MASQQGYSAGRLLLELEGQTAGFLVSAEGGEVFGSVVSEPAGTDGVIRKHLGTVAVEPLRIVFGAGMAASLYQWIADWCNGNASPRKGAVVLLNYDFKELSRLVFTGAQITGLKFPALDAAASTPANFGLTLHLQTSRLDSKGSGARAAPVDLSTAHLTSSGFRLKLDKLSTARVAGVELPDLTRALVPHKSKDAGVALGPMTVGNLVVMLPEADAKDYENWLDDFVVKGNSGDAKERNGSVEFLDSTWQSALFTASLSRLGIVRVSRLRGGEGIDVNSRVRAEFYVEQVGFAHK